MLKVTTSRLTWKFERRKEPTGKYLAHTPLLTRSLQVHRSEKRTTQGCASPSIYNRSCILIYAAVCMRRAILSRTVIDLDDEALEEAAKELGTTTKRDTINTALREVTARYRRLRALEDARQLVTDGALDIDILLDKNQYRP